MSNRSSAPVNPAEYNIGAEQALLGCVLLRDASYFDVHNDISHRDFFDPRHRIIWQTITTLATMPKGRFNIATIGDFLKSDGKDAIQRDYLEALADAVSDPSALKSYVQTVVDLSRTRALLASLRDGERKLLERIPAQPLAELVDQINGDVLDASRADSADDLTLADYARRSYQRIDNVSKGITKSDTFGWGLEAIDRQAGSAIPGHLTIIGGRSEMGKTALALGIALALGRQAPGAIFELEMRGEGLADRAMSRITNIPAERITRNEARTYDDLAAYVEAIEELEELPIYLVARPGLTREQIRARAIGLARRHGCRWFMVDHLQIIAKSDRRDGPGDTIDAACKDHAALAKELNAIWIDLSQVNSQSRDRDFDRPTPRDLMFFNSIEPHADLIMFPWRPEVSIRERKPPEPLAGDDKGERLIATWKLKIEAAKNKAEIVIGKNRHGKSGVWQECTWDGPRMRFERLAPDNRPYRDSLI